MDGAASCGRAAVLVLLSEELVPPEDLVPPEELGSSDARATMAGLMRQRRIRQRQWGRRRARAATATVHRQWHPSPHRCLLSPSPTRIRRGGAWIRRGGARIRRCSCYGGGGSGEGSRAAVGGPNPHLVWAVAFLFFCFLFDLSRRAFELP
jgi:hypothetical protein